MPNYWDYHCSARRSSIPY